MSQILPLPTGNEDEFFDPNRVYYTDYARTDRLSRNFFVRCRLYHRKDITFLLNVSILDTLDSLTSYFQTFCNGSGRPSFIIRLHDIVGTEIGKLLLPDRYTSDVLLAYASGPMDNILEIKLSTSQKTPKSVAVGDSAPEDAWV